MRLIRSGLTFAACLVVPVVGRAEPAPPRYHFKAGEELVYDLTLRTELPDRTEESIGHLYVTVESVDPANGQIVLSSHRRQQVRDKVQPGEFPPVPAFTSGTVAYGPGGLMVNDRGEVLSNRGGERLPYLLGPLSKLVVEPLPAAASTDWQVQESVVVQQTEPQRFPAFGQPPHTDRNATEVVAYHVTATGPDGISIRKTVALTTAEKVGDQPVLKQVGEATVVFDPSAGRVRSLDLKQTITFRQRNATLDVPTTLTAKLLDGDAAKAAVEADEAADARQAERNRQWQDAHAGDDKVNAEQRTALVGGTGGGEFVKVGSGSDPMIGIRYRLGDWGGAGCLRQVDPVYDREGAKDAAKPDGDAEQIRVHGRPRQVTPKVLLAKDGYAVAGLKVWADRTNAVAMQVTFCRLKDGKLLTTDKYTSETVGFAADARGAGKALGGDGRTIVGLCGRQGMNLDALGLVRAAKDDGSADEKAKN